MLASDMEIRHVGGEGLKGEGNEEEALCGFKLYKGETLLVNRTLASFTQKVI